MIYFFLKLKVLHFPVPSKKKVTCKRYKANQRDSTEIWKTSRTEVQIMHFLLDIYLDSLYKECWNKIFHKITARLTKTPAQKMNSSYFSIMSQDRLSQNS